MFATLYAQTIARTTSATTVSTLVLRHSETRSWTSSPQSVRLKQGRLTVMLERAGKQAAGCVESKLAAGCVAVAAIGVVAGEELAIAPIIRAISSRSGCGVVQAI